MKKIILIAFGMVLSIRFYSQTLTVNHPTIDSMKVVYVSSPQSTLGMAGGIEVIPQATISLKSVNGVNKLYFKMIDPVSNAVLYSVNYTLSSPAVTDQGIVLFQNSNGIISISSGQVVLLKPYLFELKTENAALEQSTVFSTTQ